MACLMQKPMVSLPYGLSSWVCCSAAAQHWTAAGRRSHLQSCLKTAAECHIYSSFQGVDEVASASAAFEGHRACTATAVDIYKLELQQH